MLTKVKKALLTRLRLREAWVIFFILGFIMLNYPFINIFNKPAKVFVLPILFIYLYSGWAVFILITGLLVTTINLPEESNDKEGKQIKR